MKTKKTTYVTPDVSIKNTIKLCNVDTDIFIELLLDRLEKCDSPKKAIVVANALLSMTAFAAAVVGAPAAAKALLLIAQNLQRPVFQISPTDSSTH